MEGRGNALQTIAAYIDLNPVRAGLVGDPKDYRFCGYAEAVAGGALARDGLQRIWADFGADALQAHRRLLFGKGASPIDAQAAGDRSHAGVAGAGDRAGATVQDDGAALSGALF